MGTNISSVNFANNYKANIDVKSLAKVSEQILNGKNFETSTINLSQNDLSKFNRISLGTDLYSEKTNGELALKISKANTDFGVQFNERLNAKIQYLNSQAAQSLFTSKENNGRVIISVENINKPSENEIITNSTQVNETFEMNKDKKGSNPFSFYVPTEKAEQNDDTEPLFQPLNFYA